MIFKRAKQLARELGWHKAKDGVFGFYKNYFFNVGDGGILSNPPYKYVIASTNELTEELKANITDELKANKKLLRFSTFEVGDNSIYVKFQENLKSTKLKKVYQLLDFLVSLFQKLNIPEQHHCHQCNSLDTLDFYTLNDRGIVMCQPCSRIIEDSFEAVEKEIYAEEKNYFSGFLGSLVFSIPGIIGWILLAVYLETIASVMAIVIGFLGLKGYQFFKGKQGPLTKYLIVISNIVTILIANIATILMILINIGLNIKEAISALQHEEAVMEVLQENILVSFLLASMVWIWLLFMLKTPKPTLKRAEKYFQPTC